MRKILLFVILGFFVVSCSSDDIFDEECGGVIDFVGSRSLLVELVDEDNNNLIENGFYDMDFIHASTSGIVLNSEDLTPEFIEEEHTLYLPTFLGNEEKNQWVISLSETDKDTLNYTLAIAEIRDKFEGVVYCGTSVTLESADYNSTTISLEDPNTQINSSYSILVKVVKTE
ncbi:hypothetical protein [Croceitalea rosinachiae]|uniref:Uncharacterized protein n=1 Tax=Croceitalea rosinachiae TaxID=3075596 RepID=A0ABU3A8J4_9FLAO|nr:hypothetical protein [Croceitalea sp. F388]MDT0606503.1 hypothetical protein [Croceitalea sp. F388]